MLANLQSLSGYIKLHQVKIVSISLANVID